MMHVMRSIMWMWLYEMFKCYQRWCMNYELLWECELYERLDDVDNDAWNMSHYVDENFMNDIDDDVNDEIYCEKRNYWMFKYH